jgi:hypothetical protein
MNLRLNHCNKICSVQCAGRAYKAKARSEKIEESNLETQLAKMKPVEEIKKKEYLTIAETCTLLSVSRWNDLESYQI